MVINGVELEDLDIFDADVAEKYENALEEVAKGSKETDGLKTSDVIRKQCNLVFECFNSLFGEGTDKRVFGGKFNLMACLKAFEELIEHANEQKKELDKLAGKYSQNRIQRRSK